jgi:hypothetical protein
MDKYGSVVKGKSFVQSADLKIYRLIVFIANERISVNAALSNHNLVQSHVVGSRDEQRPPEQKPSNAQLNSSPPSQPLVIAHHVATRAHGPRGPLLQ